MAIETFPATVARKLVPPLLAALLLAASTVGVASASGADIIRGSGTRGTATFDFHVVLTPSGLAIGRFDSNLVSSVSGLLLRGDVSCGWVSGNIGVFGGLIEGADPALATSYFTVMVSDEPDGIIFGTERPDCNTSGFGDPSSLPISSGEITVMDL